MASAASVVGSLSTGALAAAIAAPVAAALMLGLLACWWFRRIRCRRGASGAGAAVKDVEAGRLSGEMGPNARRMNRDQGAEDDARDKVCFCSALVISIMISHATSLRPLLLPGSG